MPRNARPSTSVVMSHTTRRPAPASRFSAIDAMPKVAEEVSSSSVSTNAGPIRNTCAGPGAPAVPPSIVP